MNKQIVDLKVSLDSTVAFTPFLCLKMRENKISLTESTFFKRHAQFNTMDSVIPDSMAI